MTTLIFSTGGCPSYPFYSFKRGPWYPVFRENPSREVATNDHSSSNPPKGNPPDLKTKVDVSKVDVKGFPNLGWFLGGFLGAHDSPPPRVANQPTPYRGLSDPSGPKCRKSLENVSRSLQPLSKKSREQSEKTLSTHAQNYHSTHPRHVPPCAVKTLARASSGLQGLRQGMPNKAGNIQ